MDGTLVLPVCSVSPQGGGQCVYALADGGTLPNLGTAERGEYQNYTYTATPAAGATFLRFDVTVAGYSRYNPQSQAEPFSVTTQYAGVAVGNSWQYQPNIANWRSEWFKTGYAFWDGRTSDTSALIGEVTSINVVAVFDVPHVPTHLLVNSSTLESPAKLVYDPATNLLVADF